MKTETAVVVFKAIAVTLIGIFAPWSASLAQWVNSGTWPERIVWIGVILPTSVIGGASALSAFLSGSYQNYMDNRSTETKPKEEVKQ